MAEERQAFHPPALLCTCTRGHKLISFNSQQCEIGSSVSCLFYFFVVFFFSTTANLRSVHKEFRAWRTNRMRTDARLLSSLTTAVIECLVPPPPPLLLTQLLAAAATQLSIVEKHPSTQLQFSPVFLFPTASFRHSEGQVCNLPAGTSSKFSPLKMFKFAL